LQWGPVVPYRGSNETLSGYFIPPVDVGETINISVSLFSRASLDILIFPTGEGSIAPAGPPLLQASPPGTSYATSLVSPQTQAYGIYVVSHNRTEFLLRVASVWSPYYVFRTYLLPAVALVMATGVATYYFTLATKREEVFEEALAEARSSGSGSTKAKGRGRQLSRQSKQG
jgi:hypothetical protein